MGYEGWPEFCSFCAKFGHMEDACFKKDPSLKPLRAVGSRKRADNLVYKAKEADADAKKLEGPQTVVSKEVVLKEGEALVVAASPIRVSTAPRSLLRPASCDGLRSDAHTSDASH